MDDNTYDVTELQTVITYMQLVLLSNVKLYGVSGVAARMTLNDAMVRFGQHKRENEGLVERLVDTVNRQLDGVAKYSSSREGQRVLFSQIIDESMDAL